MADTATLTPTAPSFVLIDPGYPSGSRLGPLVPHSSPVVVFAGVRIHCGICQGSRGLLQHKKGNSPIAQAPCESLCSILVSCLRGSIRVGTNNKLPDFLCMFSQASVPLLKIDQSLPSSAGWLPPTEPALQLSDEEGVVLFNSFWEEAHKLGRCTSQTLVQPV